MLLHQIEDPHNLLPLLCFRKGFNSNGESLHCQKTLLTHFLKQCHHCLKLSSPPKNTHHAVISSGIMSKPRPLPRPTKEPKSRLPSMFKPLQHLHHQIMRQSNPAFIKNSFHVPI
ncbi:hypothetical protein VIGAN_05056200 [Vigna angularis var. angularis]|uniref:Uncharacterized protein n=1 Tax=Vigna angularis var. angularis TaxID=157739 RepID=A0A0S3S324_PHAAN|nr:hypothetical protein VIGAN_05056200 [Vigna angularis var. angularis]